MCEALRYIDQPWDDRHRVRELLLLFDVGYDRTDVFFEELSKQFVAQHTRCLDPFVDVVVAVVGCTHSKACRQQLLSHVAKYVGFFACCRGNAHVWEYVDGHDLFSARPAFRFFHRIGRARPDEF